MKIVEIFKSIQGEGSNFGKQVIFIRLGNCNLKCPWCDTDWKKYKELTIQEIMEEISKYNCKNVIITGGEPTINNLTPLLKELKNKGIENIVVEDNKLALRLKFYGIDTWTHANLRLENLDQRNNYGNIAVYKFGVKIANFKIIKDD